MPSQFAHLASSQPDLLRGALFRVEPVLRWWFDFSEAESSGAISATGGQLRQGIYEPMGVCGGMERLVDPSGSVRYAEKSGLFCGPVYVGKPKRSYTPHGPTGSASATDAERKIQRAWDQLSGEAQAALSLGFASRQDVGLVELGKLRDDPLLVRAGELYAALPACPAALEGREDTAAARAWVEAQLVRVTRHGAAPALLERLVASTELQLGAWCLDFEGTPGGQEAMRARRGG
jgi:hypothetical protein